MTKQAGKKRSKFDIKLKYIKINRKGNRGEEKLSKPIEH